MHHQIKDLWAELILSNHSELCEYHEINIILTYQAYQQMDIILT